MISNADEMPTTVSTDLNNNQNILLHWFKYNRLAENSDSKSIKNSLLIPSTNPQRRNVILPRICYFSRITKSGIHKKFCLPYNDED